MKALRPQTAPSTKQRTPYDLRPLGRMMRPAASREDVAATHLSNPATVAAALKGEILLVQRKIEELRAQAGISSSNAEMEALEKHLLGINPILGSEVSALETQCSLQDLLFQRMKVASAEALRLAGNADNTIITAARTSGFLDLVEFLSKLVYRKALWDQAASEARSATEMGVQYENMARFDDAMNEPAVSELRKLVTEQKSLQTQIQHLIANPPSQHAARADMQEKTKQQEAQKKDEKRLEDALHSLEDSKKEATTLKKRIVELELELRKLREVQAESAEENEKDLARKAGAVAFANVDRAKLAKYGVDATRFVPPTEVESTTIAQRMTQALAEIAPSAADSKQPHKRKDGTVAQVSIEGSLWLTLHQQNQAVVTLLQQCDSASHALCKCEEESSRETGRLRRVVAALEQRVLETKASSSRDKAQLESLLVEERKQVATLQNRWRELQAGTGSFSRIVNVRSQAISQEEREKALRDEISHHVQCISDLKDQLRLAQDQCEVEQSNVAVVARERSGLMQQLQTEKEKIAKLNSTLQERAKEITDLKDHVLALKKELRDKAAEEADIQQRMWKLDVELHISQNVIAELRQREDVLLKEAKDAKQCQGALRDTLTQERDQVATVLAQLREQLQHAKTEQEVAQEVLRSERSRMLENEKEVERLKSLDVQMEALEQNFANYAASKLAQRDASEEEEQTLQRCVDTLEKEAFAMPSSTEAEEQVQHHLHELESKKAALENEERIRRRNKATIVNFKDERSSKKQLTALLEKRFNEIQIYACEQRLRQIAAENANRVSGIELTEIHRKHDSVVGELEQLKLQCDSLVQRNTELEMERKQLIRARTAAEQEIKNLKSSVQRMKVSGEEQEKVLVEVGTRLQTLRIQNDAKDGTGGHATPLDPVVVGAHE